MEKRRFITLIAAVLWIVSSSPCLSTALMWFHGHHRITSEIENGLVSLVFHHDGEDSDHHHPGHHQDKSDHSTRGDDHHLTTISADAATYQPVDAQVYTKYVPLIRLHNLIVFIQALPLKTSRNLLSAKAGKVPIPLFGHRTIVLLI